MGGDQTVQPVLGKETDSSTVMIEPYPSFHSLFESRQHANGPNARFDPSPSREDLSGWLSQRHCRRLVFRSLGHSTSIFLEPFAPPALPGFVATMAPLTPARRLFASSLRPAADADDEHRLFRAGLFAYCAWTSDHSVSNHHAALWTALARYPSASTTSGLLRSGLRRFLAGSPDSKAESSSLALRTGRSPSDALHPASRRRSFGRLQAGERLPEEDFHLPIQTHSQTH
jgi:hypothetical protein